MTLRTRNARLARVANKHGAHYSLRIVWEARRAGIPVSLGFALIDHESNFTNVFGHDPTIFVGAGKVTRRKYRAYKALRGHTQMQGVGPAQLTWWEFQDRADRLGGCHVPRHNIRCAFEHLAVLIQQHGKVVGLRRYNGVGPQAVLYSRAVRAREAIWHDRLAAA